MYQGLEGDGGPNPIFFLLFHLNPATSLVSKKNKKQNKKLTRHTIYLGLKGDNVRLVDLQKGMISQKPTYRQKNHASRAYSHFAESQLFKGTYSCKISYLV